MFNQYPYLNLNDLNLDYLLNEIKSMYNDVTNFVSINAIKYADPIQWNITSQYEKNTVVIDPLTGTAYISVAAVPSGVALTRTEYWTVVFDLGSFVTRAAQNFTRHWESDTTTTATFATSTGGWLVWGDVLYKALTNITAGDTYIIGGNIEHFTIEDLYNSYLNTIANILNMVGNLVDLNTTDKTSVVNAINELVGNIGDLNDLVTTEKGSLVGAINEAIETTKNFIKSSGVPIFAQLYIDSVNGDDDNDGLTTDTPIKTLTHGLELMGLYSRSIGFVFMSDHTETINYSSYQMSNLQLNSAVYGVDVVLNFPNTMNWHTGYFNPEGNSNHPFVINGDILSDGTQLYFEYCTINGLINARVNSYVRLDHSHCTGNVFTNHGQFEAATIDGNLQVNGGTAGVSNGLTVAGELVTYNYGIINVNDNTPINCTLLSLRTGALHARGNLVLNCISPENRAQFISIWGGDLICYDNLTLNNSANAAIDYAVQIRGGVFIAKSVTNNTNATKYMSNNGSVLSNLPISPQANFTYVENDYFPEDPNFTQNSYYIDRGDKVFYKFRINIQQAVPHVSNSMGTKVGHVDKAPLRDLVCLLVGRNGGFIIATIDTAGDVYFNGGNGTASGTSWYNGSVVDYRFDNNIVVS